MTRLSQTNTRTVRSGDWTKMVKFLSSRWTVGAAGGAWASAASAMAGATTGGAVAFASRHSGLGFWFC